jgi:hypothetical protein
MEASEGKSGFLLFKYWMTIVHKMGSLGLPLMLVAMMTDHCNVGLSAGTILSTPSEEMLDLGCSYLGLPCDDYKYYACYCRPAIKTNTSHGFVGHGFAVFFRVLPPVMFIPDCRHSWRLFRTNLDGMCYLVFFVEKQGDLEGAKVASLGNLFEMSRKRLVTKASFT